MKVEKATWAEVKMIWDTKLWPERDSEPVTSMVYLGGYDMSLKDEEPTFFKMVSDHGLTVGVNSIVRTGRLEFRSRGLWVHNDWRYLGLGRGLLEASKTEARKLGGKVMWTMPRDSALPAYESVGFVRTTPFFEADYGSNCYALCSLRSIEEIAHEAERYRKRREQFFREHLEEMVNRGTSTESARKVMKKLADIEEADWR